jgi:iron complex outermembrane receptor protein
LEARNASFGTRDGVLQYGGKLGVFDVAAFVQAGRTDGARAMVGADAQSLNDRRFGTAVSLAPGRVSDGRSSVEGAIDLSYDKWRLRGSIVSHDKIGMGTGVNSSLDPDHWIKVVRTMADLSWTDARITDDWGMGAQLSGANFTLDAPNGIGLFPPGALLGTSFFPDGMIGGPTRWVRTLRASMFANYMGMAGHQLRLGVGHDDHNLYRAETRKNFLLNAAGVPLPTGPVIDYNAIQPHVTPHRRASTYVYVQDEWQFANDWAMTAGLRHDHYDDIGGASNPRLALVWNAALDVTAKLLYGTAFRAPSLGEQYSLSPVAIGNVGLRPERLVSREAAISWQASVNLMANLSLFHYGATDLIVLERNAPPAPGSIFANSGAQNGRGGEVELIWTPTRALRLASSLAVQKSTVVASGNDAGYFPRRHGFSRLDWNVDARWSWHAQLNWVADRQRPAGDARPPIADYTTVAVNVRHKIGDMEWAIGIDNAFNADVREPSQGPGLALPGDLPQAGRSWYVRVSKRL